MSLTNLLQSGRLKQHKPTADEITKLFYLIDRDIADSKVSAISPDRRFATAYNAVLQAATILLHCSGYRSRGLGHHATTIEAIGLILGAQHEILVKHFDKCRERRNEIDYVSAGNVSEAEAEEMIKMAEEFRHMVVEWVKQNHPHLLQNP